MCLSLGKNSLQRIFAEGKLSIPNALKDRNEVLLVFPPETPTEAAKKLGVSRRTLHRKLHEFELQEL
jgi:transcriptional regulator of acetoin/glycerol metabolism